MALCSDWLAHDKNVVKVNADSKFLFNSFTYTTYIVT